MEFTHVRVRCPHPGHVAKTNTVGYNSLILFYQLMPLDDLTVRIRIQRKLNYIWHLLYLGLH